MQYVKTFIYFLIVLLTFHGYQKAEAQKTPPDKGMDFVPSNTIQDEWMSLYYKETNIGYVHNVTEEGLLRGEPSVRVKSYSKIEVRREGKIISTQLERNGYLDKHGKLSSFEYIHNAGDRKMVISGKRTGDNIVIEINAGGSKKKETIPFSDNLYTPGLVKYAILQSDLAVGDQVTFNILFEPTLSVATATIKLLSIKKGFIGGKKTEIYDFEENYMGITSNLIFTADGLTLEETAPQGFKTLNTDKETAMAGITPLSIMDLFLASRIKIPKPIRKPRSVKELKIQLKNMPVGFPIIDDPRQKVLNIKKRDKEIDYIFKITFETPSGNDITIPVMDETVAQYLLADHVANSDDEVIKKKSREIIGKEKLAFKAAEKIYKWVYKNIDKKLVDTVSALDTLKSGEGECQAHTNLFSALAKSAGIPTKIVLGIVYYEEFEGFMFHAWNEVYIGKGEWVSVDPTLGQLPVDATHLKLAVGGLAEQITVMTLVGKIEVEIK
ncbi:MAG: transglutaminase-like domain-containing protein [Candidatus Anammoxibacter sp.]